jgi:hypothetical protein
LVAFLLSNSQHGRNKKNVIVVVEMKLLCHHGHYAIPIQPIYSFVLLLIHSLQGSYEKARALL